MREQIITPRAGRGAAAGKGRAGEIVQRPASRDRGSSSSRAKVKGWRKVLAYLPLASKIAAAAVLGVLLFAGYRAAASASFFQARNLDVSGAARTSADEIRAVVKKDVDQTGVWRADLAAISRDLKMLPWVRDAVVSRVLPDGLRVRVTEREPRAIDWETRGISRRISEVNLNDLRDVRVQLTGDDSQIEIQLGKEDFGNRLKFALDELDRQRNTPIGPYILHINVAQGVEKGNHVTIGVSPDAPKLDAAGNNASGPEVESARVAARDTAKPPAESRKAKEKEKVTHKEDEQVRKKDQDKKDKNKKEKPAPEAKSESRPRRVG
ncbi:MAG: hypothetical protein DMF68_07885 [Acidobacteria bacterium]|nr:MAG: hypothetical protein DMF68_07885 [Acidobacteriota bacterium]